MLTNKGWYIIFIVCVSALLYNCGNNKTNESAPLFKLLEAGYTNVHFENTLKPTDSFNMIQYLYFYDGGGVATGDINNDGLTDIYFTANQGDNKLYLNKGNLEFEDITDKAGVAGFGSWTTGVTMADVNADGYLDIYVCQVGDYKSVSGKNQLFINNGDLTFTENAAEYGIDFKGFSTHASFFDYDRDGALDLYLLNHSVHTEASYGKSTLRHDHDDKAGDRLYRNDFDDKPVFVDVTEEAGIYDSQIGYGLGVTVSDLNMDGWPDLYISNDFHENDYLYINNQDGTFSEQLTEVMSHTSRSSMGNDIADFNNDGLPDIMVLDMLPEKESILKSAAGDDPYDIHKLKLDFGYHHQFVHNTLQLNRGISEGKPVFSEIAMMTGVHATDWSWASLFCDLDLDGWKDIYITNGIYRRPNDLDYLKFISAENMGRGGTNASYLSSDHDLAKKMPSVPIANYAYRNLGKLNFENTAENWGLDQPGFSNGAAYADLDNDGDLELVVNNVNDKAFVYKNNTVEFGKHNYLKVSLRSETKNTFGISAKVIIKDNGNIQYQQVMPARGFQSAVDTELVFGLADKQKIDTLMVIWPDAKYEIHTDVLANQQLTLQHNEAKGRFDYQQLINPTRNQEKHFKPIFPDSGAVFIHRENDFVDFSREPLMPHMLSREGPPLTVGDVNGDGKADFYVGGANGQVSALYLQNETSFAKSEQQVFLQDSFYEDVDAVFFDADGDGDLDLYVCSGGNEYHGDSRYMQDRLYINDGKGYFMKDDGFPALHENTSCVRMADYDNDGDPDIFVGIRNKVTRYGVAPSGYLLQNNGKGVFSDVTSDVFPHLTNIGMITDAEWLDINDDGLKDLIIVGEWMPVQVFINDKRSFKPVGVSGLKDTKGWWNKIVVADMDNDGDQDLIVGNLGKNSKLKATPDYPVELFVRDFERSGRPDQVLCYWKNGKRYPVESYDALKSQIPSLKQQYKTYTAFAGETIEEIFSENALKGARHYEANELRSCYIENTGNLQFEVRPLPERAQMAPIYAMHAEDLNGDGLKDLILGGNFTGLKPHMGRYDASYGLTLMHIQDGSFKAMEPLKSGFFVKGEIKEVAKIHHRNLGNLLIITRNDDAVLFFRIHESKDAL